MYDPRLNKYYLSEVEGEAIQAALYALPPEIAKELTNEYVGKLDAAMRKMIYEGLIAQTNIPISSEDIPAAVEEAERIIRDVRN